MHTWVWLHLMLTFAYSGEPLPTHCSTKFTTVLRGSDGVGVLRHDSMWIFASSPPGGVTPHSARKVQIVPASGISSELRAHQMAPGGVVAHSSPPAGVVAQVVRSLHAAFRSWFLRLVLHVRTSSSLVLVLGRAKKGGARHRCWSDIRSGELPLLLCVLRPRPAPRAQTWPAIEFVFGEEGLRPASSYISSCVRSLSMWTLLWGRGEMAERCSDRFGLCLRAAVLSVCSLLSIIIFPVCRLIIDPAGSVGPRGTGCDSDWKLLLQRRGGTPPGWCGLRVTVRSLLRRMRFLSGAPSSLTRSSVSRQRLDSGSVMSVFEIFVCSTKQPQSYRLLAPLRI